VQVRELLELLDCVLSLRGRGGRRGRCAHAHERVRRVAELLSDRLPSGVVRDRRVRPLARVLRVVPDGIAVSLARDLHRDTVVVFVASNAGLPSSGSTRKTILILGLSLIVVPVSCTWTTVPAPLAPVVNSSSAFLRLLLKIPMPPTLTAIGGGPKERRGRDSNPRASRPAAFKAAAINQTLPPLR
jgi:hypothetical protein